MTILAAVDPTPCWCGAMNWVAQFRTRRFGLVLCLHCGTFRLDPWPLQSGEALPAFYTEFYAKLRAEASPAAGHPEGGISRFWHVVRHVPNLDRPGGVVVDIGCGDGQLCGDLKRAGWARVMGIDVSLVRLESTRRAHPNVTFYDSVDAAPIPLRSVELCVMDNVIEHLPEPEVIVRRVRSWLQPGGRLVVITPNMVSGHFRLLGRRWTPELAPDQHIFLFTPRALTCLLSAAGLEVEAQGSFHLPLYPWRGWLRLLVQGDIKEAAWCLGQELGGIWGRVIGAGPMLYAVARGSGKTAAVEPAP